MRALLGLAIALTALTAAVAAVPGVSIDAFGAIPNNTSYAAAIANGVAFYNAVQAANNAPAGPNRTVLIPAGSVYTTLPFQPIEGVRSVTVAVEGTINAWPGDIWLWPNQTDGRAMHLIDFRYSSDVTITGPGLLQGNGYRWWVFVFKTTLDNRPHLLFMQSCIGSTIVGLRLENSPMYHIDWEDALGGLIEGVNIHVDVDAQKALLKANGLLSDGGWPTFPLNTDGIDISGQDIVVRRNTVTNFDDALCAKPQDGNGNLTKCTSNLLFEDSHVVWGVGASVGSVPPSNAFNCIKNTTFRNIRFTHPLKALYVKPNPVLGPNELTGRGIIDNVTYENIYVEDCVWWTIWVSTQQQRQPGNGTDTGCSFLYPLPGHECPTDFRVPVTNLKLRNITAVRSLLSPGVLRCNPKGPCTGWEWTDVSIESLTNWPMGDHFLCQSLDGAQFTNVNVNCTNTTPSALP